MSENRAALERILSRARDAAARHYGVDIPSGIPDVVFNMIRREVDFEHERGILRLHSAEDRSSSMAYPTIDEGWQTAVTIGLQYVHPSVSMKQLLGLEDGSLSLDELTDDEKGVVRRIAGAGTDLEFGRQEFRDGLAAIKRAAIDGAIDSIISSGHVHLDPHPGNILVLADASGIRTFMMDLGAEVKLDAANLMFLSGLMMGLRDSDEAMLRDAIRQRYGDGHDVALANVWRAEPKFRPIVLREKLLEAGLMICLEIQELLFSLVKLDRLIV